MNHVSLTDAKWQFRCKIFGRGANDFIAQTVSGQNEIASIDSTVLFEI